jgi:hypothetical protein
MTVEVGYDMRRQKVGSGRADSLDYHGDPATRPPVSRDSKGLL